MDLTHYDYDTTVVNPECSPADYNPAIQYHNSPSWFAQAQTREGYEQVCAECGVTPQPDAEILRRAYALHYAEYRRETWQAMRREDRVLFKLGRVRLLCAEAELKRARSRPASVREIRANCGHLIPANLLMNASMGTACPDCYDRMSG